MRACNLLALAGYVVLTLAMTYPLALSFNTAIPGDGFDGWQNYWNLWWVKAALVDRGANPFFTDYLYHPTGVSLYFHTLNIFNGLLTLPIQLLFGLTVAYNVVVLFSFVIGGYGAYLLILYVLRGWETGRPGYRRLRVLAFVAFVAGLVYTFSPFHFAHLLGHMQVLSLEWLPFYVLYLLQAVEQGVRDRGQGIRHIWKAALFLILTALCDWYYALYALIFTVLYVGYLGWVRDVERLKKALAVSVAVGLIFVVVLSPLLGPMVREASISDYMIPDQEHVLLLSADLLAFVTPNEMHPIWGGQVRAWSERFTSTTSERMVFAGYVPLVLAAFGLWGGWRRVRFWAISALTFWVLSLGPVLHVAGQSTGLPLPYALLHRYVPFMKIVRSVSRFDAVVMLSLAVLVGAGLQRVAGSNNERRKRPVIITTLAAGLICFEFLAVPYPMIAPDTPAFYYTLAQDKGDYAILNLPMDWDRPNCLLYQTVHGKRLVSAYTSRANPLSIVERTPVLQHFRYLGPDIIAQDLGRIGQSVLRALKVRYVVIDLYQLPLEAEREANLQLVGEVFGSTRPIYPDERLIVYHLSEEGENQAFLSLGQHWGPIEWRDGQAVREAGQDATIVVQAFGPETVRLKFVVQSQTVRRRLELYLDEQLVSSYDIEAEAIPQEVITPPLTLTEGQNIIRLQETNEHKETVGLIFSALDIVY